MSAGETAGVAGLGPGGFAVGAEGAPAAGTDAAGCAFLFDSGAPSAPAAFLTAAPTGTDGSDPGFEGASLVVLLLSPAAGGAAAEAVELESGAGSGLFEGSVRLDGSCGFCSLAAFLSPFFVGACVASGADSSAAGPTRTLRACACAGRASAAHSASATAAV